MPGPGAAYLRIFHDHFAVIVIDLTAKQFFRRTHNRFAAREHAVKRVAGMVPQREPNNLSLAIVPPERMRVHFPVLFRGPAQQSNLFFIEHSAREGVTFFVVFGNLFAGQWAGGHVVSPYWPKNIITVE